MPSVNLATYTVATIEEVLKHVSPASPEVGQLTMGFEAFLHSPKVQQVLPFVDPMVNRKCVEHLKKMGGVMQEQQQQQQQKEMKDEEEEMEGEMEVVQHMEEKAHVGEEGEEEKGDQHQEPGQEMVQDETFMLTGECMGEAFHKVQAEEEYKEQRQQQQRQQHQRQWQQQEEEHWHKEEFFLDAIAKRDEEDQRRYGVVTLPARHCKVFFVFPPFFST